MRDVPMPRDLSEEKVAVWLHAVLARDAEGLPWPQALARAVRALVSAKVREAVDITDTEGVMSYKEYESAEGYHVRRKKGIDAIVSRVLGDHPSRSESASDEAPRG